MPFDRTFSAVPGVVAMSGITVGAGCGRGMWGLPGVRGMGDARGDAVETGGITLFRRAAADGR
jgi:hypothetical protein